MKGCYLEKWLLTVSVFYALFSSNLSVAQVIGDTTLPVGERSQITGNPNFQIDGGATRGGNLFHSFSEFSVPTGGSALFNNAADIENIFSRVTGASISNIDGLIQANGTANLFLINPNGIIFGEDSSLNVGGSFVASTASSIKFADGTEFSAVNPSTAPLLTINVPIGLQFNGTEGDIVVRTGKPKPLASTNPFTEVEDAGQTLDTSQTVNSQSSGTSFDAISGTLSDNSDVDLYQLFLTQGQPFQATTVGGTDIDTQLFLFNATGLGLHSNDDSQRTPQSTVPDFRPFTQTVSGTYYLGISSYDNDPLSPLGNIFPMSGWNGNGEDSGAYTIYLINSNRSIGNNGTVLQVPAGQSLLLVGGNVRLEGGEIVSPSSRVELGAVAGEGIVGLRGTAGNWQLSFPDGLARADVSLSNSAQINVLAGGGGSITVMAQNVTLSEGSRLRAGINDGLGFAGAQSGNIQLDAIDRIDITEGSSISNSVRPGGTGNAGNINIQAQQLILKSNAGLFGDVSPTGQGQGADINLDISGTILLVGGATAGAGESTRITLGVLQDGIGSGGDLSIRAGSLVLQDGGLIKASTQGQGDAGNIDIRADRVDISGSVPSSGLPSGLFTSSDTAGNAGDITIHTQTFRIADGAALSARSRGILLKGQGGDITVNAARTFEALNGGQLITTTFGSGRAGSITINATEQVVLAGSDPNYVTRRAKFPNPATFGDANALQGLANAITETGDSSGLFANTDTFSAGRGGDIQIATGQLTVQAGAQLITSTSGSGRAGDITVNAPDIQLSGASSGLFAQTTTSADAGNLTIEPLGNGQSVRVNLQDGAQISASTSGDGDGGQLTITAPESITLTGNGSVIAAETGGSGKGGNLNLQTERLNIQNQAQVTVSSEGTGRAGSLFVDANQIYLDNGGRIRADTSGGGGDINLRSPLILLRNGSSITTNARGSSIPGGNIDINTDNLVAVPSENSDISANSANFRGGNVTITASGIFGIEFREQLTPLSDITATGVTSGTVNLITPGIDPARGLAELPTEVVDATDLIATGCRGVQGSSFVVTGRGGLPPNPEQQLDDDAEWLDRRRLVVAQQTPHPTPDTPTAHIKNPTSHTPIIEATGWVTLPDGQVILTASIPNVTSSNRWGQPVNCNGS